MRTSDRLLLVVLISSFLAASQLDVYAQQSAPQQRQINVIPLNLYAPIQVLAINDAGRAYPLPRGANQSVSVNDGSSNWLVNMSFNVENHSSKDIVAVEAKVSIQAWETDPRRPQRFVRFHEGKLPDHALTFANGVPIAEESTLGFALKPGESRDISLKPAAEKLLKLFPSPPVPLASADSVWIQIERVFFSDGTAWAFNTYLKPDESSPGAYIRITPEEWRTAK